MVEVREISAKTTKRLPPDKFEEQVKKLRKEGERMVKGKFEFTDAQGGWIEFAYRYFKHEPIIIMKLVHGETCELPMAIVKHINNTVKKVRKPIMTLDGSRGVSNSYEIQSRIKFIPTEMF